MDDEAAASGPDVPLLPFTLAVPGRSPFASATKPPIVHRYVPLIRTLRSYTGQRLRIDSVAGLTVAALSVPAAMAYAEVAGLRCRPVCSACCCPCSRTRSSGPRHGW